MLNTSSIPCSSHCNISNLSFSSLSCDCSLRRSMAVEYRPLELNIGSANDLKDVNHFTQMRVLVTVSVTGDPHLPQTKTTPVHKDGGTNPTWNHTVNFTVNESLVQQNRLSLEFRLISDRIIAGETLIGTVHIPLNELLDNPAADSLRQVSYPVITPSGDAKGTLNISYKFGERVVVNHPPGTEAGSSSVPYGQAGPSPQHATGYAYPPAAGYGYPPQQGNGYPAGQRPQKNNIIGMGLGAVGSLVNAVGGAMFIGNTVADVVDPGDDEQ